MKAPSLRRFATDFFMSAVEVGVMLLAWGDVRSFLSHGAHAGGSGRAFTDAGRVVLAFDFFK